MSVASQIAASIRGWLFHDEPEELERLAVGKTVLEVGSYCGKSTVIMARVAKKVVAIDDFRGAPCSNINPDSGGIAHDCGPSLRQTFFDNLEKYQVSSKVTSIVASFESAIAMLDLSNVGLVFYDSDHRYEPTYQGGRFLLERVPPNCTVAFHDYNSSDPGVIKAVDQLSRETGRPFRTVNTLAIFDGRPVPPLPDAISDVAPEATENITG